MCVRILGTNSNIKYDSSVPLEEQIKNSEKVVITYEPKDTDITKFIDEVERLCKQGISADIAIEVLHNNHLNGAKAKKQMKRLMKDLELNKAVKLLVKMQSNMDNSLEELSNFCKR